jgi:hypothetical protein
VTCDVLTIEEHLLDTINDLNVDVVPLTNLEVCCACGAGLAGCGINAVEICTMVCTTLTAGHMITNVKSL